MLSGPQTVYPTSLTFMASELPAPGPFYFHGEPMKDVSSFLAEVTESRRAAQASERSAFVPTRGLVLPEALEVALNYRLPLSPVLARSRLASNSSRVGIPSNDRAQIEYWYSQYGPEANWWMETGASSGVVVLELDPNLSWHALAHLVDDNLAWPRPLQFAAHGKWHVLFEYVRGMPSLRGYSGVRLHSGSSILVPPSRTPSGMELVYADPHAAPLSADWLRNAS